VAEVTVDQLSDWISAERTVVSDSQRERLAHEYAALAHEFNTLTEENRRLTEDRRLHGSAATALRQLAEAAIAISRLIEPEFDGVTAAEEAIVSPPVIGELIDMHRALHERLQSQLQMLDTIEAYADDLHQIVKQLLFAPFVSPALLQNLARRISLDVKNASAGRLLLPEPGLVISAHLTVQQWRSEPMIYANGIQSARLLAFAAGQMFDWTDQLELLVIAALLQDVGLLRLEERHDLTPTQLEIDKPEAYRRHPQISAALSAALTDYAVDLPLLIAQHHERCDGIGFPEGQRSDRLSAPSRFLAIAVRFVELTQRETTPKSTDIGVYLTTKAYQAAAQQLRREAEQGELDRLLTGAFLGRLGFTAVDSASELPATSRRFSLSRFGETEFSRHAAHVDLRGRSTLTDSLPQPSAPAPTFSRAQERRAGKSAIGQPDTRTQQ
jgi:HD-GYP domain-containing protein (c-di-GMP phosphodiesterase class II)